MELGKVVVWVTLDVDEFEDPKSDAPVFLAGLRELNLHAHGKDRQSAIDNVKFHFRHFIEGLRETGELKNRLEKLGVKWTTYEEARLAGVVVEDLSPELNPDDWPKAQLRLPSTVSSMQLLPAAA